MIDRVIVIEIIYKIFSPLSKKRKEEEEEEERKHERETRIFLRLM